MLLRHTRRLATTLALLGLMAVVTSAPAHANLSVTLIGNVPASAATTASQVPNTSMNFELTTGQFTTKGTAFGEVFLGQPTLMDLSTVSLSSSGPGTATIVFSMNNLTAPIGAGGIFQSITAQFLRASTGSFALTTYGSQANTLYTSVPVVAPPTVVATPTVVVSGGSSTANFTSVNPFSLTQVLVITFTSAGTVSLSSDSQAQFIIPEPSTVALALTGAPMLGLYWLRRRRARA
ncbi:MAG: PEP-CTERM sorting domain-containing protein [Isosphaeraceae bacterium]